MSEFITSIVVFCVFYIPLRLMRNAWRRGKLAAGFRWAAGLLAWGALLSAPAPLIVLILALIDIFSHVSMGSVFTLGSLLFLSSIIAYVVIGNSEVLDYAGMKEFWYRSLFFQNPAARRDNIFHAADWHEVASIHFEETGKTLTPEQQRVPDLPRATVEQAMKELAKHRSEPVPRDDLGSELQRLKDGETVDVMDPFRLNMFRRKTHVRYDDIQSMTIDPAQGMLKFRIVFPELQPPAIADADGQFRMLQEVYDVLHALGGEMWLQHYASFFATVFAECYRVETDSFDMPTHVPFLRVHCPVTELHTDADRIYIVTELTRLHRVEWVG